MEEKVQHSSDEAFGMDLSGIVGMSENTEEGRKKAEKNFNDFLSSIESTKKFKDLTKKELTTDITLFQRYGTFLKEKKIDYIIVDPVLRTSRTIKTSVSPNTVKAYFSLLKSAITKNSRTELGIWEGV